MTKTTKSTEKSFEEKLAQLNKLLSSKDGATEIAFKNVYGPHAMSVLREYVERKASVPPRATKPSDKEAGDEGKKKRRAPRPPERYSPKGDVTLPSMEEYRTALNKKYTNTASNLVEDGYAAIEELAAEAREVAENMESGNLGQTSRCQTFQETADVLEGITISMLPGIFGEVELVRLPTLSDSTSRSHRLSEALDDLRMACDAVESWVEAEKTQREIEAEGEETGEEDDDTDYQEIEDAIQEIRDHADEAEGVEFPGMYG